MSQRFNDSLVHIWVARDQFPEWLAAHFLVIAFLGLAITAITAAVYGDEMFPLAVNASRLFEVFPHFFDLAGISPIRAGLDRDDVADAISVEFEINSFRGRFPSAVCKRAHMDGKRFEKVAKDGFFLRGQVSIQQLFYQVMCRLDVLRLEQIRILARQNL